MSQAKPTLAAPGHWATINEVSFVLGMRLLFWVYRLLGRWPFRLVLYPVLLWYVISQGAARRASAKYLQHIAHTTAAHTTPARSIDSSWRGILRHFAAFAETILDKMMLWGGLFPVADVQFFGLAPMLELIQRGQGAVLLCSHLGNLELCRVLSLQQAGLKLTVLVHTRHAPAFNRMLAQLDPRSQLDLLQVTEMTPATAMLLNEKVQQGGFIVIAADRVPVAARPRVAMARFLGQNAAFPVGPYVLAAILHCPLYCLFSMRHGQHSEVHFELLRERVTLPRKGRDAALAELAAAYAAKLEYFCLRTPLQWFNFYDFWQTPHLEPVDAPQ